MKLKFIIVSIIIVIIIIITILFTSVFKYPFNKKNATTMEESTFTTTISNTTSYVALTLSVDEQKAAQKQFYDVVDNFINAKNVQNVRITGITHYKGNEYNLTSTNVSIIQEWKNLLQKIKISAYPFSLPAGGVGCELSYSVNNNEMNLLNFIDGYIFENPKYIYKIKNYNDIYNELQTLKDKMGYQEN